MPWGWGWFADSREEREDEEGGYSLGAVEAGYSPLVVVVVVVVVELCCGVGGGVGLCAFPIGCKLDPNEAGGGNSGLVAVGVTALNPPPPFALLLGRGSDSEWNCVCKWAFPGRAVRSLGSCSWAVGVEVVTWR